jgi:hypothetical protein
VINFTIEDEINFLYIEYFSYLLANSLGIHVNRDINYKKEVLKLNKIYENDLIFQKTEIDLEKQRQKLDKLKTELLKFYPEKINEEEINKIKELYFEKDHNEIHQIDFLYSSSNLRAKNFNIELCSIDKVNFISGNIVPSIPTTTASIVGYISTQIYTLFQTTDIKYLRQINIDLSTPFILLFSPKKPFKNKDKTDPKTGILTKAIPPNFTCWDIIEIKGNKTVGDLLDYIGENYKVDVTGLYTLDNKSIIKDESSFDLLFQDAYYSAIGRDKPEKENNSLYFKVLADLVDSDIHANMPKFKYIMN